MKVYHRTSAAEAILQHGFRDGEGCYMTATRWRGVWVSDQPLDENEGAWGDTVSTLDLPEDVFVHHEWVQEGFRYREALIPATVLNQYPRTVWEEPEES